MAKAGVTWRWIEKLRASLNEITSYSRMNNEKIKKLGIPSFAHPSEKDFASVLDFYRIKWEYEPRSFPIEWDKEGRVVEEFTPDFYLPELGTYIELTTLKQKLVTKKNRKLRRLRELYPNVNVRIFYGRDYKRLLHRFGIK
jgi:hypoxanthine phosphoribosyltransferase